MALDDAITDAEITARDLANGVAKLREIRGRLDRAMQAYRSVKRDEPVVPVHARIPSVRDAWSVQPVQPPVPANGDARGDEPDDEPREQF